MFWSKEEKEGEEEEKEKEIQELKKEIEKKRGEKVSEKELEREPSRRKRPGLRMRPEPSREGRRPRQFERPPHEGKEFAPLFVKIDRYEDVLKRLGEIRTLLDRISKLLSLLKDIDSIKMETMDAFKDSISEITDSLIALDEEFVRPEGVKEFIPEPESRPKVESYISDLQSELKSLRSELTSIE